MNTTTNGHCTTSQSQASTNTECSQGYSMKAIVASNSISAHSWGGPGPLGGMMHTQRRTFGPKNYDKFVI